MHLIIVLLSLWALTAANPIQIQSGNFSINEDVIKELMEMVQRSDHDVLNAELNEFADKIFTNIGAFMVKSRLDPFDMPDIHEGISYNLIITYHGELDLTNGLVKDISTIHRGGPLKISYDKGKANKISVIIPITFNALAVTYDYSVKIMSLGPTGGVNAKITDLAVEVQVSFDFSKYEAAVDHFYIRRSGHIELKFTGNGLIDWLLNVLINVISAALHRVILLVIESIIRNPIQSVVDAINEVLNAIFHPTTISSLSVLY